MKTKIETSELISSLNAAVADMVDTRVNNFGIFHGEVRKRVEPVLKPLGFLYNGCWRVRIAEGIEPFMLHLELKEDKGWKANRRGRIISLEFKPEPDALGETIEAVCQNLRAAELKKQIGDLAGATAKARADIDKWEALMLQYSDELAQLTAHRKGGRE